MFRIQAERAVPSPRRSICLLVALATACRTLARLLWPSPCASGLQQPNGAPAAGLTHATSEHVQVEALLRKLMVMQEAQAADSPTNMRLWTA